MKKYIKIILFIILVSIIVIFYNNNFVSSDLEKKSFYDKYQINAESSKQSNNLIKNLEYNINLNENSKYIITSDFGEIKKNENAQEIVEMKKTKAIFLDKNKTNLIVTSNLSSYNTSTQNIIFYDNVNVEYLDKNISADQMKFDYEKKLLTLNNNVTIKDMNTIMSTDNIKIDLISKKIEIYMNNEENVIKINSNY